jgi:hypothetical protein
MCYFMLSQITQELAASIHHTLCQSIMKLVYFLTDVTGRQEGNTYSIEHWGQECLFMWEYF